MAQAKMDFVVNTRVDKTAFVELKKEIQSLKGLTEKDLINFGSASNFQEAKKQLAAIQNSATTVEAALNKAFSPKLGTVSLSKFNTELKKMDLQKLANDFSKAGAAGNAAFRSLTTNVLTTKIQIKETHKLLDDMGKTMSNTIKWGLSSSAWNTMTGSFQKAYGYVKDLDKSLNNIRIVSGQSADDMARFAVQANRAAKALGASTLDYTDAALIYYQQGLNEKQVAERTNTTVKLANVLGVSAEEVSDYMTAIWNNFDDGSKSIEYYADVLTKLGAATASSAEEISTGLEKFAAIADTVGLSYEYATAALTTVTATTRQSAEVVGTAFKTLFARIQDLELGETLEDGVTLGKYSEALRAIGVNVTDSNGNLKDMNDILNEMGGKWDTLTKAQQVSLAQTVAGTRQYTQLVALMDNWDYFQQNLQTASSATGELNKQQEIYLESTQAHLDKLSTSAERLYSNLIDSEGLNDLIDVFDKIVVGASEFTEAIGGSKSVLMQLGNVLTKVYGRTISQSIATSVSNFQKLKEQAKDFNAQAQIIQQFKGITVSDQAYNKLVDMAEAAYNYKEIMSEAQVEEANAIMAGYNDAVNARDMWQEAKNYAQSYYSFFTHEETGSLDNTFSNEQLEQYFKNLDEKIFEYEKRLGSAKIEINKNLESYSAGTIEEYIDSAQQMLENKIIKNEQLETKLRAILAKYEKAGPLKDNETLTDEQVKALQDFGDTYGKIADDILKDTKKVKETFIEAQKGMSDANETAVNEMEGTWDDYINKMNTQSLAQDFMDLTGQLMSISSAIASIRNIPNIWSNDNLTTGEKMLQTVIAVANAAQGVANTFRLVHTTARLLTTTMLGNAGVTGIATEALKKHETEVEDNIRGYTMLQEDIEKTTEAHNTSQQEIKESTQETVKNTSIVDDNSKAVYQNTLVRKGNTEEIKNGTLAKRLDAELADFSNDSNVEEAQRLAEKVGVSDRLEEIQSTDEWQKLFNKYMGGQKRSYGAQQKKVSDTQQTLFDPVDDAEVLRGMREAATKKANREWAKNHPKDLQTMVDAMWEEPEGKNADDLIDKTKELKEGVEDVGEAGKKLKGDKKGGLFAGLKEDFKGIVSVLKAIPPQAYIAAAAVAVIAASIYLIAEAIETEKERDERLRKTVEETEEAYRKTVEASQELYDSISAYESGVEGLEGLTKGTIEYYEAIVAANAAAQELIDKLGLLAGTDYTLSPDGLIQIDEDVLTEAAKEAQKESYRAQAAVYYAKEDEVRQSSGGIRGTVEDATAEVNKKFKAAGLRGNKKFEISTDQMEKILRGESLEKTTYQQTPIFNSKPVRLNASTNSQEDKFNTLIDLNKQNNIITKNLEKPQLEMNKELACQTPKYDRMISLADENNMLTEEMNIDITDTIAKYSAKYQSLNAQADAYALAAADQSIRGYGTDSQIAQYENSTETGKNLMQQYVDKQKKKNVKKVDEVNVTKSTVGGGLAGGLAGAGAGAAAGATFLGIGAIPGAIAGFIGGAIGGAAGANAGAKEAKKRQEEQLKTLYAENALGYTVNDNGDWYDSNNQLVTKDEKEQILKDINLNTAKKAYESGDYSTKKSLELIQTQLGNNIDKAMEDGHDMESARYIGEAMVAAKEGLDYDYSLLTEEEMAYFKEQITEIGNSTGTLDRYSEALKATSDPQKRLRQDTKNYNDELAAQAQQLGTTTNALKIYHRSLTAAGKAEGDLNQATAKSVGAVYSFNKAWNNAVDTFENTEDAYDMWLDSLKSGEEIPYDVADAMGELMTSLESVLGFSVDADFMEKNSDLIKDFLSEDRDAAEKAYKQLKDAALKNTLSGMGDYITDLDAFVNAINNMEAGDTLSEEYAGQLSSMLQNTQKTKEELEQLFGAMNLEMPDVENSPDWEKVTDKQGGTTTTHHYTGEYPTGKTDANGNMITAPVNYSWTETTDPKEFTYYKLKKDASLTYKSTGNSTATSFARTLAATKKNQGSKSEPKKEEKIKDEKDRYHDVNIKLKQISNSLEKVQKQQRGLVGKDLIKNLAEQYALLNKQIETTAEKMRIAEGEADELAAKLSKKGVKFGADGTISNYADAYDKQLAKVNAVIDKFNKMSAKQQEKYQATVDKAKEEWEEFLENISRYDEILTDELPSMMSEIQDSLSEQIDLKLEAFEYEIKIRLDLSEAKREWEEFKADILEGKDLENDPLAAAKVNKEKMNTYFNDEGTGSLQATTNHINKIMEQLAQMDANQVAGVYGETYTYTNSKGEDITIDFNDREKALEDLKTYIDENIGGLTEFNELMGDIYGNYVDLLGKIQESFDKQTEAFETLDSMIQHDMELIKMAYGEDSYKELSELYDKDLENSKAKLAALSAQVDYWKKEVADQRAYVATLEKGTDEWWRASEALAAAEESLNGAIDAESQAVLDAMQKITDKLLFNIDKVFFNLNKSVTGGLGLEYASLEWELIGAKADDYLDTVNAIYSTQQLQNKYLDAIEKSSNPAHQKKLNDLMEQETKYLREQDKLSQYDLDRANLKYELALKQIALEEAQQNKSKLRLRRDSQGNYTYQYTADNDQVASVQQEINDLYNQLYNLDADQYRGNLEKIYDVWAEAQEKMREAAQINDPDKRLAYEQLITKEYGDRINALTEENENIKSNLYQSTMSQLLELYNTDTANYEQMTQEQKDILDKYITEETELNGAAFDNLFGLYNENITELQSMVDEEKDILMNSLVPQWNSAYQQMVDTIVGEGGFEATLGAAFETIKAQAFAAFEELKKYETEYSERSENNKTYITDQLTSAETLLDMYQKDLPEIKSMISDLAKAWDEVTKSIEGATTAANTYYTTTQEKNADDAADEDPIGDNDGGNEPSGQNEGGDTGSGGNTGGNNDNKPSLTKGSSVKLKAGTTWYGNSYGGGGSGSTSKQRSVKITLVNESGSHPYHVDKLGWVRKKDIVGYASGGYTGDWTGTDGRLAMLHKKELILNAHDTDNMLNAITILRDITANLGATLLNRMASISAGGVGALGAAGAATGLEQMVTINAEFPNVTNSHEIEDAINNLVNRASQHISK